MSGPITRKTWTEQDFEQATDAADDLSTKLNGLKHLVELAAFASEAKRVLTAIEDQLSYRPEMQAKLMDNIEAMYEWTGMRDTSSEALAYIAREMEQSTNGLTELAYRLAVRLRDSARDPDGGRAEA